MCTEEIGAVTFLPEQVIHRELFGAYSQEAMLRINSGPRASLRVCVRPVFYSIIKKTVLAFVFALARLCAG